MTSTQLKESGKNSQRERWSCRIGGLFTAQGKPPITVRTWPAGSGLMDQRKTDALNRLGDALIIASVALSVVWIFIEWLA